MKPVYLERIAAMLALLAMCLLTTPSLADDFEDALKDAFRELLEEKAEDAGIPIGASTQPEKVLLVFTGAKPPSPDVLEPIIPPSAASPTTETGAEQACFNNVQNRIPWDAAGRNKSWSASNVRNLCRGTTVAAEPGNCFRYAMYSGSAWGKTSAHKMTWSNALQLCAGTSNASQTTQCFANAIKGGAQLQNAVNQCDANPATREGLARFAYMPLFNATVAKPSAATVKNGSSTPAVNNIIRPAPRMPLNTGQTANSEAQCRDLVQGKIAWDAQGRNKSWNPKNVERLCKGTTSAAAPGNCFKYAMRSGASWGKRPGDVMNWSHAVDLCEGTSNHQTTTTCFRNSIAAGRSVADAVRQCDK